MSGVVEAIALGTPILIPSVVFAKRRFDNGINAFDNNIAEGIGNIDICAGQALKGARATNEVSKAIETGTSASKSIKAMSAAELSQKGNGILGGIAKAIDSAKNSSQIFKGVCKVVQFTSENINPVIYTVGGIKVIGADKDDRLETAAEEGSAIFTMRVGEEAVSNTFGMTKMVRDKKTGKMVMQKREMNPYIKKFTDDVKTQLKKNESIVKFAKNNPALVKGCPALAVGILFPATSILCYSAGKKGAKAFLGTNESETNHAAA